VPKCPFRGGGADEHYGMIPRFLDGVEARQTWYVAEVPASTKVWIGAPQVEAPGQGALGRLRQHPRLAHGEAKAQELAQVAAGLPAEAWQRYTVKEGSKGPIEAMFALVRVTRARRGRPDTPAWLICRRSTDETNDLHVFLSNAPATCAPEDWVWVSGLRWPVETAIEEAKGELGMDHYETRTWRGWHPHMTQTFLAHHFWVRMRLRVKKKRRP
jgi:SRSO17 transposase